MIKLVFKLGVIVLLLGVIVGAGLLIYGIIDGRIDTSHDIQAELSDELRGTYEKRLADAKAMIDSQKDKDRDWQEYLHAGVAAQNLGKYGEAESYYKTFIKQFPEDYKGLASYGKLLFQMGRLKDAEEVYVKLVGVGTAEEDLRSYIEVLKAQNSDGSRDADIITALENAIPSYGQSPYIMQTLADWYETHGQCTLAVDHLKVLAQVVSKEMKPQVESDIERVRTTCTNK